MKSMLATNESDLFPKITTTAVKNKLWSLRKQKFLVAFYADPPVISRGGTITMPHAWSSFAEEVAKVARFSGSDGEVIRAKWTPIGGLAILAAIPLSDIVGMESRSSQITCRATTVCSTLHHWTRSMKNGIEYADEAIVTNFKLIPGNEGCNPGGCLYFPNAPYMNKLVKKLRYDSLRAEAYGDYPTTEDIRRFKEFCDAPKLNQHIIKSLGYCFYDYMYENSMAINEIAKALKPVIAYDNRLIVQET